MIQYYEDMSISMLQMLILLLSVRFREAIRYYLNMLMKKQQLNLHIIL